MAQGKIGNGNEGHKFLIFFPGLLLFVNTMVLIMWENQVFIWLSKGEYSVLPFLLNIKLF
jgi:hypothetical protein